MEPIAVALAVIIVIVFIILLGGVYLGSTQKHINPTPAPTTVPWTVPTFPPETTSPAAPETAPPTPEVTTPEPTPTMPATYVVAATPFHDRKYYPLPYYSTIYDPRVNLPPVIFQQTYKLNFQDEAVVAKVAKAPLIIDFSVTPAFYNPNKVYFFLTIRNNDTQQLLAQDGFYGPYSENSPKRMFFSSPGTYHINMNGGFVSVSLTLRAPNP